MGIEHTTVDGNVWCTINGVRCEARTLETGFTTTLSQCFNESGHNVSSLCSAEALETAAQHAETVPLVLVGSLLALLMSFILAIILIQFGCLNQCKMAGRQCCPPEKAEKRSDRWTISTAFFVLLFWIAQYIYIFSKNLMDNIV